MSTPTRFGVLLRTLRKRVGMTQGDLAAAVGYSVAAISALEQERRLPVVEFVVQSLVPALALADAPQLATRLVELAATARGERPPTAITVQRAAQVVIHEEVIDQPNRLPLLPIALIGRAAQVNQLCDRLLGHGGRLLTLVGPPGIGKTTLALAVAAQVQPHYRDGAVFVALAAITEPTLMASTIATAVGCSDASPKPPQVRLIESLRRKRMLLVLDNLEQITGSGVLLAELVAECPGVCVLVTSRERLHLRAEQRFKVPPLDLTAAVELFVRRAQAVDANFALTPYNQPTIEAICQRLDCLPLALELCAAQIDLRSPTQLLAHLQTRPLDLLVEGAHDLPPRQHTLRTAIGHSYALLADEERTLLRSLGVFVGGFDLAAAETVVTDSLSTAARPPASILHALIGKSLVHVETLPSGEQRFLLLETIREFALEQLRACGEEAILRQRHYATYLQLFRIGDSYLRRAEAAIWFERLQLEQENLRAALQWTLDEACYADTAWLMIAVDWFWQIRGYWYERGKWMAQLIPHHQVLPTDLHLALLIILYSTARAWEEFQPINRWTGEMMQLMEVCAHKLLQAAAWLFIAASTADFAQAAPVWERALACARAAREEPGIGPEFCLLADDDFVFVSCLCDYTNALIAHGEIKRAIPLLEESLEVFRQRANQYEIADGLGTLGFLMLLQGNLVEAARLLHEAVTIATTFNHQAMVGSWQPLLGLVTLYMGNGSEAYRLLNESLRLGIELRNMDRLARVCAFLADLALEEGELVQAEQWLRQSLGYSANAHWPTIYEVARCWVAARLATAQQQYRRAATLFGVAEQMHRPLHYAVAGPMRALADAALANVQASLAPEVFAETFAVGQQMPLEEAFVTLRP